MTEGPKITTINGLSKTLGYNLSNMLPNLKTVETFFSCCFSLVLKSSLKYLSDSNEGNLKQKCADLLLAMDSANDVAKRIKLDFLNEHADFSIGCRLLS